MLVLSLLSVLFVYPVRPVLDVGVLWPNGGMDQDETRQAVGLSRGHIVLYGTQLPIPNGHSPQFSAHICCGQMAGWIKMPLDMEEGLGPGDFVLDGDPAPCLLYTSPSPRDRQKSRMPSSA